MNKYCVGPAMAVDWGEGELEGVDRRRMILRVLTYFRPYRGPGLLAVAAIAAQAVLGLAPAVVFKAMLDTLARPHPSFGHIGLLVAAGIGAVVVSGLIGVGQSWLSTVISQGIVVRLRRTLYSSLQDQPVSIYTTHQAAALL